MRGIETIHPNPFPLSGKVHSFFALEMVRIIWPGRLHSTQLYLRV